MSTVTSQSEKTEKTDDSQRNSIVKGDEEVDTDDTDGSEDSQKDIIGPNTLSREKRRFTRGHIVDIDELVKGTYDHIYSMNHEFDQIMQSHGKGQFDDLDLYDMDRKTLRLFNDFNDAWDTFHSALDGLNYQHERLRDVWFNDIRHQKKRELKALKALHSPKSSPDVGTRDQRKSKKSKKSKKIQQ